VTSVEGVGPEVPGRHVITGRARAGCRSRLRAPQCRPFCRSRASTAADRLTGIGSRPGASSARDLARPPQETWRVLRKLRCCPWCAGQLAEAVRVLQVREARQDEKVQLLDCTKIIESCKLRKNL
jgi:hypothetical protein